MFYLLAIAVLLVAMLLVNGIGSLLVWLLWLALRRRMATWAAATTARALFLMRTLPVAVSVGSVLFLVTPAFLIYEPRSGYESVSLKLGLLAICAAAGVVLASLRAAANWRATSRLVRDWLAQAEPVQLPSIKIPSYRFEHRFPLIAVVGIMRPKLFIASHIFTSLTGEELSAALYHEAGHIAARDNLKRALMRGCRDLVVLGPFMGTLDRAWLDATESAADDHASQVGVNTNVDLASALVKIARMVPAGMRPTVTAGAFLISNDTTTGFRSRVGRLLQREDNPKPDTFSGSFTWLLTAGVVGGAVLVIKFPQVLIGTHYAIEHLVHFLR